MAHKSKQIFFTPQTQLLSTNVYVFCIHYVFIIYYNMFFSVIQLPGLLNDFFIPMKHIVYHI